VTDQLPLFGEAREVAASEIRDLAPVRNGAAERENGLRRRPARPQRVASRCSGTLAFRPLDEGLRAAVAETLATLKGAQIRDESNGTVVPVGRYSRLGDGSGK
jgi:hypothetical protein